uniref:SUMO-activating enzyme subunit 1 n=1 Tax=Aceria tosichella TaxID=561515 RepID=A0A6G1S9Q5_9ACAR
MLTKDEAELYDRQIRLWGVNAQSRLRQSKVLMLGFNGIASEVAKILVLAGIDTLSIVDHEELKEEDLTSNLFCRTRGDENKFRTHQVKEKLKTLNPLVKVNIDNSTITDKNSDDFQGYDLVTLHTFLPIDQIKRINDICRQGKIKFYLVLDYGFFGFMFNDLGRDFQFTHEEFKENDPPKQTGKAKDPIDLREEDQEEEEGRPKKRLRLEDPVDPSETKPESKDDDKDMKKHKASTLSYASFENMISFRETRFDKNSSPVLFISVAMMKFYDENSRLPQTQEDLSKLNEIIASIKDSLNLHDGIFKKLSPEWSQNISGSLSPVCAIVGGVAGQDMIRALSGKDIPVCNTFSFDGLEMAGVVERVAIQDSSEAKVQPVVRDLLQIDDDD